MLVFHADSSCVAACSAGNRHVDAWLDRGGRHPGIERDGMVETIRARRAQGSASPGAAQLRDAILAKLTYSLGKDSAHASSHDWFLACALAVRDGVIDRWMHSTRQIYTEQKKRVYYLSVEFLL